MWLKMKAIGNNTKINIKAINATKVEIRVVIPKTGIIIVIDNTDTKVMSNITPTIIIIFNGKLLMSLKYIGFLFILFLLHISTL